MRTVQAGMIGFAAVSGGVGASLTGGNFFDGFIIGGTIAGLNDALHKWGESSPDSVDNSYERDGKGGYRQISTEGGNDTDYLYENGLRIASIDVSSSTYEMTRRSYGIKAGSPALIDVDVIGTFLGVKGITTGLYQLGKFGFSLYNASRVIQTGKYTITKTVAKNLTSRPYINSPSTITNIMKSGKGALDAFFKGGVNYKVSGSFNGSKGIFELGINSKTNHIYHFLFRSKK